MIVSAHLAIHEYDWKRNQKRVKSYEVFSRHGMRRKEYSRTCAVYGVKALVVICIMEMCRKDSSSIRMRYLLCNPHRIIRHGNDCGGNACKA